MHQRKPHLNDDKAVGYVRLSAVPVAYDSFSQDNQRRIIQEAAKREGHEAAVE